ncbi:MAG: hypothetical protein J6I65_08150 [Lachnospiraceae bacterium]|nr:hypothetical protein [Lachnospiraceae bacterium]
MKNFFNKCKNIDINYILVPLCLFAGLWVLWAFTGQWPNTENPFNTYALQADSWLKGHLNLIDGAKHGNLELAVFENQYYVSFPPFPSYVLLPFVLLLGSVQTPDHWLALISYLSAGIFAVKIYHTLCKDNIICESFKKHSGLAMFFPLFLLMGSNVVYTSMNGWVWFLAQNFAFTLSLASIYFALKNHGGLSLGLLACAVGCRPMQILYFPIILFILWQGLKSETIKQKWYWILPPALIGLSYMILNYARFGSITEFGHNYLPEFTRTEEGQFNLEYLSENLGRMFRLPEKLQNGKLDFYYFDGFNIFLISPIFLAFIIAVIYGIREKKNRILAIMLLLLMTVHIFSILMHRTLGGSHFGNRYFNDLLPFAYFGMLTFMPKKEWFAKLCYPLCILGIILNYVGTVICQANLYQYLT